VDRALLAAAAKGEAPVRAEAIRALAARRTAGAGQTLLKLAADPDEAVRVAAFDALAVVGGPGEYSKLLDLIVSPSSASAAAAQAAENAALATGGRVADIDAGGRNQLLLGALEKAPARSKPPLLRLLSVCHGSEVLQAVRDCIRHKDAEVANAAVRALANWSSVAAAGDLLELAENSRDPVQRTLALRGYLRLARTAGADRVKMLNQVRGIAKTAAAKRLLLSAIGDAGDAAALELAVSFLDDAEVPREAALAALKVAEALVGTDRQAVRAGMERLQAKVADAALRKQAEALHAESLKPPRRRGVGGSDVGLQGDKARSDAAKEQLAKRAPKGYRLACYLDCGPDTADGAKGGPTLRFLGGQAYSWAGADRVADVRFGTVHFSGQEVSFEAAGLNPKRTYLLGFTWWDFDHNTRIQSVWASAGKPSRTVKLLGATKLPSYSADEKKAEEKTLPIPRDISAFGAVRVTFRNEGSPNVVVSEVWLWQSEANSPPAAPMPVQSSPPANSRPAAVAGPKAAKAADAAPRKTEPAPFRPGKKALKRVLIVTGIDYPGHKWRLTTPVLAAGLDKDPRLAIEVVETPDFLASAKLADYDALVLHFMNWQTPDPGPAARENLRKLVAGGKGLVLVHFACGAFQGWPEFAKLAGRAWDPKLRGHDPYGRFGVDIVDADHPVTKGMKAFQTQDELYTCLAGDAPIRVLAAATSKVDKKQYPMAFVLSYGKGRVFHSVLGHDVQAFGPPVLELFRRGTAWTAGLEPTAKP
jgi:type 1 glutamine amidotransferase